MARRNQQGGVSLNLDSLMDTLTNVVGFLVIVLALTQLGVGQAVKRIIRKSDDAMLNVTPEKLTAALEEAEELKKLLDELHIKREELAAESLKQPLSPEAIRKLIEQLRQDLEKTKQVTANAEELRKQIAEREKQAQQLEQDIVSTADELASLRALLDKTPQSKEPPAKIITLPNPRAAPSGAKQVLFACRHGQIVPVDPADLQKIAQAEIAQFLKAQKARDFIDGEKIRSLFDKKYVGTRSFRIRFRKDDNHPDGGYLILEQRDDAGESVKSVARNNSPFAQTIRKLDKGKQYTRFLVWADSFDTYIQARKVTELLGVQAGWDAFAEKQDWGYSVGGGFRTGDPKAPKPTPPPPPPSTKPAKPVPLDQVD